MNPTKRPGMPISSLLELLPCQCHVDRRQRGSRYLGSEGLVESFHLLGKAKIPTRCFIQMEATAVADAIQGAAEGVSGKRRLARRQCCNACKVRGLSWDNWAACNRLHEAEERLARWLLMVCDRVDSRKPIS